MNQDSNNSKPTEDKSLKTEVDSTPFLTVEGTPYEITEEGSLGILAMGYAGIMLWREKKYSSISKAEKK